MTSNSPQNIIHRLELNVHVFESLFVVSSHEEYLWKANANEWCLLEVVCHLVDEEILDFRTRVKAALEPQKYPFESIDPIGWVIEKEYLKQDYSSKTQEWVEQRKKSIEWLTALQNPVWHNSLQHPKLGPISAEEFLTNWLAHDHIHIRQINRIKRGYLSHVSRHSLSYAGKW